MVCHCALNWLCRPAAWKVKYGAGPSGYTWVQLQVTWPGRPVASTMARSVAALTLSWNDSNRSQVIAVSKRIVDDAPLNGALARKGHANKGIAPGAGRAFAVSVG
jgi:hypothetical protein